MQFLAQEAGSKHRTCSTTLQGSCTACIATGHPVQVTKTSSAGVHSCMRFKQTECLWQRSCQGSVRGHMMLCTCALSSTKYHKHQRTHDAVHMRLSSTKYHSRSAALLCFVWLPAFMLPTCMPPQATSTVACGGMLYYSNRRLATAPLFSSAGVRSCSIQRCPANNMRRRDTPQCLFVISKKKTPHFGQVLVGLISRSMAALGAAIVL